MMSVRKKTIHLEAKTHCSGPSHYSIFCGSLLRPANWIEQLTTQLYLQYLKCCTGMETENDSNVEKKCTIINIELHFMKLKSH
jgi:hypothetical protein